MTLLAFPTPSNASTPGVPPASHAAAQQTTTHNPHGPLAIPCDNCHTSAGWRPIRAVPEFDHNKTSYPLRGGHEKVPCVQCHAKPVFTNVAKNCADCHADIHRRQFGPNCAQCHTVQGWNIATQQVKDHQNRFPLFGAHSAVECSECHKSAGTGIYFGLSTQCDSCHLKDWQNTTNPNHSKAGPSFAPGKCSGCHGFDSWLGAKFDHTSTGFPLTAGHANVACELCHINGNYNLTIAPADCGNAGCHLTTWKQTTNPVHSSAGSAFAASNCANCHTTQGWDEASFNHSLTGFTLVGTHMSPVPTPCAACHINNNYTLTSANTDCIGCHLTDWNKTQTIGGAVPNHITAGFPTTASSCSTCHTITTWADGKFDHTAIGFPLTNGHANVPCSACHINNNYNLKIAPTDCGNAGCHLTTWQQTNNPVHSTAGTTFAASNCANCHTTKGWDGASFDHSVTGFALVGTHMSPTPTPCASCHINSNYTLTSANTDCMFCHTPDWNKTQTMGGNVPNHITAGFPSTASGCSSCHTITTWADGKFDHSTTGFLLTNGHANVGCSACHINANYNLKIAPTDCGNSGCHLTTWQQTDNPVHSTSGTAFAASNCANCHTTKGWDSASFDHGVTGWALTGAHVTTACTACHVNNNYTLTSANTACLGCHQDKYNSTQSMGGQVPNHVAANFPGAQCSTCHTTTNWTSTWNHNSTGFPLQNLHQFSPAGKINSCTDCHISNNYSLQIAPTACGTSGCHLTTWQQTNNPVHSTSGSAFGLANCSTCHTTAGWDSASFDHSVTGFTLVGTHKTTACAQCHINNNYSLTSANTDCMSCHLSAWNSTQTLGGNVPNHVASGFPTTATACATCHTITVWADGKFDHSTTGWALTGAHITTACNLCHISNNYTLTSANTACYPCHVADWNSTQTLGGTVPNHVAAGFPTTCNTSGCHTTTSWLGATFDHSNYFPIPHHGSVCNDCHQVSTDFSSFTCINCHTKSAHSKKETDGDHGGVPGYSYGPTICYNCHKNGGGG